MSKLAFNEAAIRDLPSPPAALSKIVTAAADPSTPHQVLIDLISQQPAFMVELLRAANRFDVSRSDVRTPQRAVAALGLRSVRNLAVSHVARVTASSFEPPGFDISKFWEDSLRRGTAARLIAERLPSVEAQEAFTIGLVQDVGTLMLATLVPDKAAELQTYQFKPVSERIAAEKALCGVSHDKLFAHVGKMWGLPKDILQMVFAHHDLGGGTYEGNVLANVLRAADLAADLFQARAQGDSVLEAWSALENLGIELSLEELARELEENMADHAEGLGIEVGPQPSMSQLIVEVNSSLLKMTSEYENLTRDLEAALRERETLMQQLNEKNRELTRLATTDPLTGAANRRHFRDVAQAALDRGGCISFVMCDLDKFKQVNDVYGHGCGDDVLKETVRRFQDALEIHQMLGRLGGEEFALCLPDASIDEANHIAERCRVALESSPVHCSDGTIIPITGSFGGVTWEGPGGSLDQLLQSADAGLYESKDGGRNQVTWMNAPAMA